jgi:sodium transport system ATP-binding protein
MIQVQNLRKTFSGHPAVRDVSFEAPDGAITGLLGANGAGKTTTLRMLCGVLQPDSGSTAIDGLAAAAARRRLGALLDHSGIYPRLTLRENLAYYGELHGISTAILNTKIDWAIGTFGLQSIADRRTGSFSQGERMKTALARAILHGPRNLLLDAPTNGLDVSAVRSLRELLLRLRAGGMCICRRAFRRTSAHGPASIPWRTPLSPLRRPRR